MARGYANKFAAAGATIAAIAYATIAGHHVSTTRALVMVLAYTVAIMIDRARELAASLAIAALVICFALPGSTADIGFQLSFASVIAILLGMRRFDSWWRQRNTSAVGIRVERTPLRRITSGPLVTWRFPSGLCRYGAAHGVPFQPGFDSGPRRERPRCSDHGIWRGNHRPRGGTGELHLDGPCSRTIAICRRARSDGTGLARWFAGWPFAWTRIFTPTIVEIVIAYGFLALWLFAPLPEDRINVARHTDELETIHNPALRDCDWWRARTLAGALAIDAAWWIYQRYLDSDLRVTFLSVGQGDGAVVRFPGSRVMLIDGGGGFPEASTPARVVAPYLWANKIGHVDYLVLSHPDRDHFGGLIFIARNFSPNEFWTGGTVSSDVSYATLIEAVRSAGARSRLCQARRRP